MRKYFFLKVFTTTCRKSQYSIDFAVRGNQFCLLPCIRWKGYEDDEAHAIHFMFLVFVIGLRKVQVYK